MGSEELSWSGGVSAELSAELSSPGGVSAELSWSGGVSAELSSSWLRLESLFELSSCGSELELSILFIKLLLNFKLMRLTIITNFYFFDGIRDLLIVVRHDVIFCGNSS